MKKALWLSLVLVHLSFSLMSQSGFRPGFVIKNNGDTLNGLVFYGTNSKLEKSCLFKRFEIAQKVSYTASEIRAFGFRNGRYFESKRTGGKNTFYECIVKGTVSIFVKAGKYKGLVYVESGTTGFFKLARGNNRIDGAGNFSDFRETLAWVMKNSGNQVNPIDGLAYNSGDIAKLVRTSAATSTSPSKGYYRTPGVNYFRDYSIGSIGSPWKIGLTGGYQFLSVNVPGNVYTRYFREAEFNKSYRPAIGIFINRKLSRRSNLLSLDMSVIYLKDSYYGYSEYSDGSETFRDDILIDFSEIQLPLSFVFTLGKGNIHPYLKAGGYMSFLLDQSYDRYSEQQYAESIYTEHIADYTLGRDLGFLAGAGIEFKLGQARSFNLEAVYSKGNRLLTHANSNYSSTLGTNVISIMARINF